MRSASKPAARVRVLGAGIAVALCAALTAGCGVADESSSVVDTVKEVVQDSPKEKLVAAAPTTSTAPYTFTIVQKGSPADASDATGAVNAPGKAYELTTTTKDAELGYTLTMKFRVIAKQTWIKVKFTDAEDLGLPEIPEKWMLVDGSKLKSTDIPLEFKEQDEDPGRLGPLFTSIVDATEAGGGKYTGTLDYSTQATTEILPPGTVKALGEKAKSLPFTATVVDDKVTEFVLSIPAAGKSKAQTYTVGYGEYGSAAPVVAPTAAEATETPDFVYELLNG